MFLHKLAAGAACALLLITAALAGWIALPDARGQQPPVPRAFLVRADKPDDTKPAPAAKPAGAGTILLLGDSSLSGS